MPRTEKIRDKNEAETEGMAYLVTDPVWEPSDGEAPNAYTIIDAMFWLQIGTQCGCPLRGSTSS